MPLAVPVATMTDRDERLFAEIHRDHLGIVGRVTTAFAAERSDREELFQDILIALWRALPQFGEHARLSTYVYRVALSTALNWKRARVRYARKLERYGEALTFADESPSSRDQARLRWLYARIRELPPVDRSLMLLSLDRVGYDEIAAITGISSSNVGVRLHRIKQQLSQQTETLNDEI